MRFCHFVILGFLLLCTFSCKYGGVRKNHSPAQLEKLRLEFNLPKERTFVLDTGYIKHLFSLDTAKYADEIKNHYQPIQAVYYNKSGKLISFHINCYAGIGVKDNDPLNWNQRNAFVSFVPESVAPTDSILALAKHLQFLKTFDNKPIDTTGFSLFDYTIIIHWGKRWRPGDCRNLIQTVTENSLLAVDKKINILYVNNDYRW